MAIIADAKPLPGDGERLAGISRRDDERTESANESKEFRLAEGLDVIPDRSVIQGRIRHPRHESGRGVGFPFDVHHGAYPSAEGELDGVAEHAASSAEVDVV